MINKKIIWVFLIALSIFVCIASRFCIAEDSRDSAKALCDYAIGRYKKGDIPDAIHEFKKTLMIDPNNVTAKDYLVKIYSEIDSASSNLPGAPKVTATSDYKSQISKLKQELSDYQKQLKSLNDKYVAKEKELQQLTQELQAQKGLLSKKEEESLAAQKARKGEMESLKSQMSQLKEENLSYRNMLQSLKSEYSAGLEKKDKEIKKLESKAGEKKTTLFQWLMGKTEDNPPDLECQSVEMEHFFSGKEAIPEKQPQCDSCENSRD